MLYKKIIEDESGQLMQEDLVSGYSYKNLLRAEIQEQMNKKQKPVTATRVRAIRPNYVERTRIEHRNKMRKTNAIRMGFALLLILGSLWCIVALVFLL